MRGVETALAWRHAFLVASSASLALCLPASANAQGSGPAPGMEALFWLFMAGAAISVLVLSSVLFLVGKKLLFKDGKASWPAKLVLFAASILASCVAGVMIMILFDIR